MLQKPSRQTAVYPIRKYSGVMRSQQLAFSAPRELLTEIAMTSQLFATNCLASNLNTN